MGYRHGEISHTSAVSERPVHAIQGFQVNRGEPVSSASLCKMRYARQPKGRMAKVLQVVGCPNSVRLESRYLNCDKFTTTSVCSIPTAQCQVSDERYGAAGQCAKNRSHICSRARKRYAWLTYVNFRKGRQSDER